MTDDPKPVPYGHTVLFQGEIWTIIGSRGTLLYLARLKKRVLASDEEVKKL